jgi:ATP-dependent DNA helicase RecG
LRQDHTPVSFTIHDLEKFISEPEGERLEFKEAKSSYQFDKLVEYAAALSNEGGGTIILGVTDQRPRKIVGTAAFKEPGRTVAGLAERLPLRITWAEIDHPDGRVLMFSIPPRPLGVPIQANGIYWKRAGDALVPLTPQELRTIFDEAGPDFSAELHPSATSSDLDEAAIERFRQMWRKKSGNPALDSVPAHQLLEDAELSFDGKLTVAALILFGTRQALGRYLPQAEVVFEYRSSEASIAHQQRIEYRQGFFGFLDELWNTINLRNEVLHYQDGLFIVDVPVFNEIVVREAVLNAVTHRDYRLPGSIFVRQFPRKLEIVSPGGFPAGITVENILRKQLPRNRRIAEACAKCGLVERSGQGANRMFEESIKEGKPKPDFAGTDEHQVSLTLQGDIQNPQFLRFLEKIGAQQLASFSVDDLLALDALQREEPVPAELRANLNRLVEHGIVERVSRGRGVRFVLSRKFYSFLGKKGAYTRTRGLDRETNKALLLRHIEEAGPEGARLHDLQEVLKAHSRPQIQTLLRELKEEGKVHVKGLTRGALWFSGKAAP